MPRTGWLVLVLALGATGVPRALGAQDDLARLCRSSKTLAVGEWASFRLRRGSRRDAHVRLAIVDSERPGGRTLYQLELKYGQAIDDPHPLIAKILVPDTSVRPVGTRVLMTKARSLPAVMATDPTLQVIMRRIRQEYPTVSTAEACSGAHAVGWETLDVPAGPFRALHVRETDGEVWLADNVPFGVIRVVSADGEMVLMARGADAKASISEGPFPIPQWIPVEDVTLDSTHRVHVMKALCDSLVHDNLIRQDSEPYMPPGVYSRLLASGLLSSIEDRPHLIPGGKGPQYPKGLVRFGAEGRVVIQGIVDTTGRVQRGTLVVMSAPYPELGVAARQYVERAHFAPGRICGRPVRVLIQLPIDYKIAPRGSQ